MILSMYVARRFLRLLVMTSLVFGAILFLIDMVEEVRRFADDGVGLTGAAGLALLNIPASFYSILPLITVLTGIALFLNLSRNSELVASRAAGRSGVRVLVAPAVTAALAGALAVAVLNPVVAATTKRYDAATARIRSDEGQTVSLGDSAVWLRQALRAEGPGGTEVRGQMVIRASRASPEATTLYGASFMVFGPDRGPLRRIEAAEAHLVAGAWRLNRVKEWPLTEANPEAMARTADSLDLPTDLTAARIRDSFGRPEAIPVWQLPAFIRGLERAGLSALRHKVWFQLELTRPLLMAAMVAVAAVFTMRHTRGRKMGGLVVAAFACGVGLFFLRNLAQVLGENGDIPPALAGWAPPIVALLFALGALLRLEDG